MRALWLSQVLREAGLRVEEVGGWQQRGWEPFDPVGVMAHHTAGRCPRGSLGIVTHGRSDLPGPLSQLLLTCDGIYIVIAAGRANHAGAGAWRGVSGNSRFIGIEAEHPGTRSVPWPSVQLDAYHRGVAALLKKLGRGAEWCCAHREYATPAGRKVDPIALDMGAFRSRVAAAMSDPLPPPQGDDDMKQDEREALYHIMAVANHLNARQEGVLGQLGNVIRDGQLRDQRLERLEKKVDALSAGDSTHSHGS